MKRCFFLSFYWLVCSAALSQKNIPEFGKIDLADLRMASCAFEPDAAAMKLFDNTESELTYDQYSSTLKSERRVRIKIFKESGYGYATVKISFPRKNSAYKIADLKAIIYNLDEAGNLVSQKLEKRDFFKNKADDYTGVINFTFPQVKPGSVVEYSYVQTEYDNFQLDTWLAQDIIPTGYSVNTVIIPGEAGIKEKYFGDTVLQRRILLSGNREKYIYAKENVPSFVGEPYMSSARDNLLRVSYVLLPQANRVMNFLTETNILWSIAGRRWLNSRFVMGQIATDIPGTENLLKQAKSISSVYDRVQFLFRAVKAQGPSTVEQTRVPFDISEAWKNKNGSTAELNLILINLLRRAGVPCFPLLVSTRSHGNIRNDFPSFSQFNGMDVVAVDSAKVYILDAGVKSQTIDVPPPNVLNRLGLLLNDDKITWLQIGDARPLFKQDVIVKASLNKDGNLAGTLTKTSYDYAKMALLDSSDQVNSKPATDRSGGMVVNDYKRVNPELDSDPINEQMTFEWPTQQTGNFSFIKPPFLLPLGKNSFASETRNTDVDFGCNQEYRFALTVDVPPAHAVESLPKSVVLQSPDSAFYFERTCTQSTTAVTLAQRFEIKKSQFNKGNYPAIRDYFKKLYALTDEEIIFKRKN